MSTGLSVLAVIASLILGGSLLVIGLENFLEPWDKKEKIFGAIKLTIGTLILLANLALLVVATEDQAKFEMKCLSKGGFPQSNICYKDGKAVELDEEGCN